MEEFRPELSGRRQRVLISSLSLATALVLGYYLYWLVLWAPNYSSYFDGSATTPVVGFFISFFLLVISCVVTFVWFRWANFLIVCATLIALFCFFQTEKSISAGLNSWIFLNLPDPKVYVTDREALLAKIRIASVALVTFVSVISALRLFPARWTVRATPLARRVWPAFFVCFLVLSVWFFRSVVPYRTAEFDHGGRPRLVLLHIRKEGMQFHETQIAIARDMKFDISQDNRRLVQYRFGETIVTGVLTSTLQAKIFSLPKYAELGEPEKEPPKVLRAWNAEGWYLYDMNNFWAYTTENEKAPPEKIVRTFTDIENLPVSAGSSWYLKDICMGFCYDTMAAMGFRNPVQRCYREPDGTVNCR